MLELRGVSKRYGETEAVRSVDLTVGRGSTVVLIGPSGCGKSTLLRMIIGLVSPDYGDVIFDGARVTAESAPELRRRMGYVIQEGGLFPHLTARRNVELMARHIGTDDARIRERLEELVALTRFPGDALDRYPTELSGGQRQRVSLMRALMLDPDLLLLDEPLAALDPMIRSDLQEDLCAIFQAVGKTVILVTHDMGEAVYFGGTIVLLRDGSIMLQGKAQDLIEQTGDPFVTRFIRAQRSPLDCLEEPGGDA